jgi:hypothetical protein
MPLAKGTATKASFLTNADSYSQWADVLVKVFVIYEQCCSRSRITVLNFVCHCVYTVLFYWPSVILLQGKLRSGLNWFHVDFVPRTSVILWPYFMCNFYCLQLGCRAFCFHSKWPQTFWPGSWVARIKVTVMYIRSFILRQVDSLYLGEFSTECDLVLLFQFTVSSVFLKTILYSSFGTCWHIDVQGRGN